MQGHKCDRCGDFESEEQVSGHYDHDISFGYRWTTEEHKKESRVRYDLCNECRTELVDWVEIND